MDRIINFILRFFMKPRHVYKCSTCYASIVVYGRPDRLCWSCKVDHWEHTHTKCLVYFGKDPWYKWILRWLYLSAWIFLILQAVLTVVHWISRLIH